jgi:holo-[acyl-carrier protein] synthase
MIIGVGTDIVDHDENSKLLAFDKLGRFPDRILSPSELVIYQQNPNPVFIAGRFAAKEATLKCLGTGMHDDIALTDVEILQTSTGQPLIKLSGYVKKIANSMGVINWHISISHSNNTSFAFVVAES